MTELIPNNVYTVTEYCGMLALEGKFIGIHESLSCQPLNSILIFETTQPNKWYKYFGAKWEVSGSTTKPSFYLRSFSYGNDPENLELCNKPLKLKIKLFNK